MRLKPQRISWLLVIALSVWVVWCVGIYFLHPPVPRFQFSSSVPSELIGFSEDSRFLVWETPWIDGQPSRPTLRRLDLRTGSIATLQLDKRERELTASQTGISGRPNACFYVTSDGMRAYCEIEIDKATFVAIGSFETGEIEREIPFGEEVPRKLEPFGNYLAILRKYAEGDGRDFKVIEVATGRECKFPMLRKGHHWYSPEDARFQVVEGLFTAASFLGDDQNFIHMWRYDGDQIVNHFQFPGELVSISRDGTLAMAKIEDRVVIINTKTGSEVSSWKLSDQRTVQSGEFSNDNRHVFLAVQARSSQNDSCESYDVANGRLIASLKDNDSRFFPVLNRRFDATWNSMLLGGRRAVASRYYYDGKVIDLLNPDEATATPTDRRLLAATVDYDLFAYTNTAPSPLSELAKKFSIPIYWLKGLLPEESSQIEIVSLADPTHITRWNDNPNQGMFSPDGLHLASINLDLSRSTLNVWTLPISKPWLHILAWSLAPVFLWLILIKGASLISRFFRRRSATMHNE